jgi:hypothetical protein
MISEEKVKKLFDEWDKSLTTDMKKHWKKNEKSLEEHQTNSEMHSRFWFARDVVRHIRAKIFESKNY